jgi:pyruvate dehydrogenase E2 component (dihydrolipoamide acetyltransferase)
MAAEIKMPPLSQTTDTVTLMEWLVKEGDTIQKGDPIAGVETDKVTMQVESFTGGIVLKLLGEPGQEIEVGTVIAFVGEKGEEVPETYLSGGPAETETPASAAETAPASAAEPAVSRQPSAGPSAPAPQAGIKATPLVQNFAQKRGVDLSRVQGSGPGGLIVKADVVAFLEAGGAAGAAEAAGPAPAGVEAAGQAEARAGGETGLSWKEEPLSKNQQTIARRLSAAAAEVPVYYLRSTVILDRAYAWREKNRTREGGKISVYTFYVYAAARALKAFPFVNGFYRDGLHCVYNSVNIGFAVAVGRELFVPVVRDADNKQIMEIDEEVRWLTAKAQNSRLDPADITDGSFTVSNLGVYPVDEFSAVISPGQSGVIAVGKSGKRIVVEEDSSMRIVQAADITGSFDHRIVNGAAAAEFMGRIKNILEEEF